MGVDLGPRPVLAAIALAAALFTASCADTEVALEFGISGIILMLLFLAWSSGAAHRSYGQRPIPERHASGGRHDSSRAGPSLLQMV